MEQRAFVARTARTKFWAFPRDAVAVKAVWQFLSEGVVFAIFVTLYVGADYTRK